MQYEFEVKELEEDLEYVSTPQILVAHAKNGHLKVSIYFMANTALEIIGGVAKPAMGKVKLQYTAKSHMGAYTASQTLRKIEFTFTSPQGMANKFEFHGQKET